MYRETRDSYIEVIGVPWDSPETVGARYEVDAQAVENMRNPDGTVTRASVEEWLDYRAGGFEMIVDFHAVLQDQNGMIVDLPWGTTDGERTFHQASAQSQVAVHRRSSEPGSFD